RCRAVRVRRHAEHDLVDPRYGMADDGSAEGADAHGRGVRHMHRRVFLEALGAALAVRQAQERASGSLTPSSSKGERARHGKAVLISMLPKDLAYADRFRMTRDAGFDAIEMQTIVQADEAAEIGEASRKAGLRIHSVMNADHWRFPLSSPDRDAVNRS